MIASRSESAASALIALVSKMSFLRLHSQRYSSIGSLPEPQPLRPF